MVAKVSVLYPAFSLQLSLVDCFGVYRHLLHVATVEEIHFVVDLSLGSKLWFDSVFLLVIHLSKFTVNYLTNNIGEFLLEWHEKY